VQGLPAYCPKCGLVFASNAITFRGNATNVTLGGNREPCPRCGGMAEGIDGNFDFVGNAIRVNRASPRTLAILTVIQAALVEAQQGKPESEVIATIEKASPELATEIRKKVSRAGQPVLVALLLSLLATCSISTTGTLNWNQLVDQVRVYQTGKAPYPGLERSAPNASEPEAKPKMSRQQRRYKERQTKKQQQRTERQHPKKPS
jgi:hypothetical protein